MAKAPMIPERKNMAYKLYRRKKKLADAIAEDSSAVKRGSVAKAAGTIAPVGGNASARAYGPGSLYESGYGGSTVSAPHSADSAQGAQGGSIDDYYGSIISTLHNYGASPELPGLENLYSQLEAFLRPAVDSAIEDRRNYGMTAMAELDADAYSRGMGGSTYLSSMKKREYDSIARDIARLESDYSAELAQYVYNASVEFARIRAQLYETELQHRNAMEEIAYRNRLAGGADEPEESESSGYYNDYFNYISSLKPNDRQSFLHSNLSYWRKLRESAQSALTPGEYERLIDEIFRIAANGSGSGSGYGRSGAGSRSNRPNTLD